MSVTTACHRRPASAEPQPEPLKEPNVIGDRFQKGVECTVTQSASGQVTHAEASNRSQPTTSHCTQLTVTRTRVSYVGSREEKSVSSAP